MWLKTVSADRTTTVNLRAEYGSVAHVVSLWMRLCVDRECIICILVTCTMIKYAETNKNYNPQKLRRFDCVDTEYTTFNTSYLCNKYVGTKKIASTQLPTCAMSTVRFHEHSHSGRDCVLIGNVIYSY